MKRVFIAAVRAPLVQFAVLGAALFYAHAAVRGDTAADERRRITLSADLIDKLTSDELAKGSGEPAEHVMQAVIDGYVADEVLYREAMSLGLDRGDPVVRRRLVQKMEFLLEGGLEDPSEAELQAHLDANSDEFALPATVTFEHIYFDRGRRTDAVDLARSYVVQPTGADPSTVGDSFAAGRSFTQRPKSMVAGLFGAEFAEQLFSAPIGQWHGPIESQFGWHAVRVTALVPARVAALDDVRGRVLAGYLRVRRAGARREAIAALRATYDIELPDTVARAQ